MALATAEKTGCRGWTSQVGGPCQGHFPGCVVASGLRELTAGGNAYGAHGVLHIAPPRCMGIYHYPSLKILLERDSFQRGWQGRGENGDPE